MRGEPKDQHRRLIFYTIYNKTLKLPKKRTCFQFNFNFDTDNSIAMRDPAITNTLEALLGAIYTSLPFLMHFFIYYIYKAAMLIMNVNCLSRLNNFVFLELTWRYHRFNNSFVQFKVFLLFCYFLCFCGVIKLT